MVLLLLAKCSRKGICTEGRFSFRIFGGRFAFQKEDMDVCSYCASDPNLEFSIKLFLDQGMDFMIGEHQSSILNESWSVIL